MRRAGAPAASPLTEERRGPSGDRFGLGCHLAEPVTVWGRGLDARSPLESLPSGSDSRPVHTFNCT